MVPRENKNDAFTKFWRTIKQYYGIFENGQLGKQTSQAKEVYLGS